MAENNDELLDYEEQEDQEDQVADGIAGDSTARRDVKGTYVSIHSSGFRDFLLKPELLRAIVDCGFEHPSEGLLELVWFRTSLSRTVATVPSQSTFRQCIVNNKYTISFLSAGPVRVYKTLHCLSLVSKILR